MESIRRNPALFMIEGILFIFLGTLAIAVPQLTTISIALIVGFVFVLGGIYRFFRTIIHRKEVRYFWLSLVTAILAVLIGAYLLANPIVSIFIMTLLLAAFFLLDGISSIVFSFMLRKENRYWGMMFFSGILTFILAALIISGLPSSAAWTIGLLVGIYLIVNGISLTVLAASAPFLERSMRV